MNKQEESTPEASDIDPSNTQSEGVAQTNGVAKDDGLKQADGITQDDQAIEPSQHLFPISDALAPADTEGSTVESVGVSAELSTSDDGHREVLTTSIEAASSADEGVTTDGIVNDADDSPASRKLAEPADEADGVDPVETLQVFVPSEAPEATDTPVSLEVADAPGGLAVNEDTDTVGSVEAVNPPDSSTNAAPKSKAKSKSKSKTPPAAASEPEVVAESGFANLGLSSQIEANIASLGYTQPTAVQSGIIKHVAAGRDVIAQSQTGSGKTAAFALPILSNLHRDGGNDDGSPVALVLAPTRELAMQVASAFRRYAGLDEADSDDSYRGRRGGDKPSGGKRHRDGVSITTVYGGQEYAPQIRSLRRGVDVVVGTPGRIIDLIKRGDLRLNQIRCLVLDEADEMLNMGFVEDVERVLSETPPTRQVALFSATMPSEIRRLASRYLNDPEKVSIEQKTRTADGIRQRAVIAPNRLKPEVLARVLEAETTDGVIIFTKTKESTLVVAETLNQRGFRSTALNGDMPQNVRERAIEQLKSGRIDVLVATDVAARGLDVSRVSHVVNFDLPHDTESYIHRIGRTGRAGRSGEAILMVTPAQRRGLKQIERATQNRIEIVEVPTADAINAARIERFKQTIARSVAEEDLTFFEDLVRQCVEESGLDPIQVAAAIAHGQYRGEKFLAKDLPAAKRRSREEFDGDDRGPARGNRRDRQVGPPEPGKTRYRLAVGFRDQVKPGHIVGAIANEGGLTGADIGPLQIFESFTLVDLPNDLNGDVIDKLRSTRVAHRPINIRPDTGPPTGGRGGRRYDNKPGYNKSGGRPGGRYGGKPGGKRSGRGSGSTAPRYERNGDSQRSDNGQRSDTGQHSDTGQRNGEGQRGGYGGYGGKPGGKRGSKPSGHTGGHGGGPGSSRGGKASGGEANRSFKRGKRFDKKRPDKS